jgi:hypothetical protein
MAHHHGHVHVTITSSKLCSTRKGEQTYSVYYAQMKGFTDEMAATSKRLEGEEVICYILDGLDFIYNSFVEAFTAKTEPQTLNDMHSQLLTAEARVESQKEHQHISANAAQRGGRGGGGRGPMRGHGNGGFNGGWGGGRNGNKIPC